MLTRIHLHSRLRAQMAEGFRVVRRSSSNKAARFQKHRYPEGEQQERQSRP